MIEPILNAALTEGQKALANFGLKLATVMVGSVGSVLIVRQVHQFDEPISEQEFQSPEGLKKAVGRAARDSCISAGCSITASVVYNVASDAILKS